MSNKMKKKPHSPEFKFKVAIEAIRGDKTTAELCQEYGVVSSQIFKWKKGSMFAAPRFRFHTSDNFLANGLTRKQAIVAWTSIPT